MNGADFGGRATAGPRAAGSVVHRVTKKGEAERERSERSGGRTGAASDAAPFAAPFVTGQAAAIDVPAWPLHGVVWLQPELAPSVPAWSGLAIERRNRVPAPGFLQPDGAPLDRPDAPDTLLDALKPDASPEIPRSGLAPLGWDPRAVCKREGSE